MKINNTVIRNSNFQFDSNDKCKISNNGAIFQILSSKLYSDKFNSIVREISSNMYDSHKAANKLDVPFVININHEYIEFKDFGIGLSEEEIDQIYKVYFNSTKSGDNNYIGGFGLGSKTPFAYTNIFNISSRKNGKKVDYICFMDDKFQPNIKKIGESSIDLSDTGFTVKFNIANNSDYESFLRAVQTNFDFYKVKPIVNNKQLEASVDYHPKKTLSNNFEYENFKYELMFSDHVGYWDQKINIIVGNIKYDISLNTLSMDDDHDFSRMFYNYILNIYIPVGSISLTVNREKIEYDKNTIDFLTNCLKLIQKDLVKQIVTIFTTPNNLEERRLIYGSFGSISNTTDLQILRRNVSEKYHFMKYYYNKYSKRLKEYGVYHIYDELYNYYNNKEKNIVYDDINFGKNNKIIKLLKEKLHEKDIGYFYVLKSEPTEELYKLTGINTIIKLSDFLGIKYEECIKIVKKTRKINDNFRLINYFSGLQKTVKEGYLIDISNTKQKTLNRIKDYLKNDLNVDLFIYDKSKKSQIQDLIKDKKLRFIMNDIKFSDLLNLYDGFLKNMHRYIETSSNYYQNHNRTKQNFNERDFEEYMKYIDCIKDDKIQDDSIFVYNHLFNAYSPLNNCIFEQRLAFYNKIKSVLNKKIQNIKKYYDLFLDLKYNKVNTNILNNLYQTVKLNGNIS